jgi:hypothetical protein
MMIGLRILLTTECKRQDLRVPEPLVFTECKKLAVRDSDPLVSTECKKLGVKDHPDPLVFQMQKFSGRVLLHFVVRIQEVDFKISEPLYCSGCSSVLIVCRMCWTAGKKRWSAKDPSCSTHLPRQAENFDSQ